MFSCLSVSLYANFLKQTFYPPQLKRPAVPPVMRCNYNVPLCYVKCKSFFHNFAINFFLFVTTPIFWLYFYGGQGENHAVSHAFLPYFFTSPCGTGHTRQEFVTFFVTFLFPDRLCDYKTAMVLFLFHTFLFLFYRLNFAPLSPLSGISSWFILLSYL